MAFCEVKKVKAEFESLCDMGKVSNEIKVLMSRTGDIIIRLCHPKGSAEAVVSLHSAELSILKKLKW